jgi:sugar phosphate isomerase/epimerase
VKLAYAVATPDTVDATMLAMRGPLARSFATLARLGYSGVDLMVRDPAALEPDALAGLAADHGLTIVSLSTGQARKEDGLSLASLDEGARTRAVDRGRAFLTLAGRLGAQVNIGTLRGTLPDGPDRPAARAAAVGGLRILLAEARAIGVRLAIEPQCRYISNWINTVSEARALAAELAEPDARPSRGDVAQGRVQGREDGLALLLDLYHLELEEASVYAAIVDAGRLTTLVQVADSNRLPPGAGHAPFGELLRVLAAVGYDGFVAVEALQRPDSDEAAARAARHLLPLLERISAERSAR